ncbi:hypothetical protein C4J93_2352 [Pseudomonas sp. R2-37-08W]|nr:hypothetical protein C4J93_2352 [Pseudomonas sp. R2-37-08W]
MAVGQCQIVWLIHRYRGQAPSHIWFMDIRNTEPIDTKAIREK